MFDNGGFLTGTTIRSAISVPLVWRPVSRLFLGLAPTYEFDIRRDYGDDIIGPKVSSFAFHGLLGAYFYN